MKTYEEAFNEAYPQGLSSFGAMNEAFKEVFQKGYESRDSLIEELMDRIKILEEDAIRASIENACC